VSDDSERRFEQLERRVRQLEAEVQQLRFGDRPAASMPPPAPPPPPTGETRRLSQLTNESAPEPPLESPSAPALDGETALKWGGVGLVVLAVGFAVSTAISRGWIGPGLQIVGAIAISLALIGAGMRLRATRMSWTHALCTGGVAALFITVASDLFLREIASDVAFGATIAIGLVGYGLARVVPSEWVASTALLGGLLGWLVIVDGTPEFAPTLTWFSLLVTVALVLALEQRWFGLRLLAQLVGLIVVLALAGDADGGPEQIAVLVAGAFLVLSLVRIPSIGDLGSPWQELEVQLAAATAPWTFVVIGSVYDIGSDSTLGFVALGASMVVAGLAFAVRTQIRPAHHVSLLLGSSVGLSVALALLFSTDAAFLAIAIQGAGLVVLARLLGGSLRVLANAAILGLISATYGLVATIEAWTTDAPIADDVARLVIIVALGIGLWQTRHETVRRFGSGVVLSLLLVWLGSVLVHFPQGQAAVSISWAVVGTSVLVVGALRKVPDFGAAGLSVLALTVAKLLVVDMGEVDTLWRAGLFFVVGLGFLRLGFLLPALTATGDPIDSGLDADQAVTEHR
jgi:uncharacterized membrane protein